MGSVSEWSIERLYWKKQIIRSPPAVNMLRPRKMPPFFKLTLVVLCAYILWTFNHPENVYTPGDVHLGPNMQGYNREYPPNQPPQPPMARVAEKTFTFPDCAAGPSLNVAFLKTHKTGSSTMSNIMLRYADTHNLTVGLPLEGKWELGGYPAYIDKRLIDPELPGYNILGHHFRFNKQKLDEFMNPDTKYVTIIRSPVDNVESVFGFFQDQEPFMHWMEEIETTQRLGTFYADPTRFFNHDTDWYMRSKNYMCFDIGYSVEMDDDAIIDQKIAVMEQQLTFVLLTDYFDESLIL